MTDKQEKKMIKAANKYWLNESGGYDKEDIMKDAFVEGYKQAFALTDVSSMFSAKQMEKAYDDGVEAEQQRCGDFDIENYG